MWFAKIIKAVKATVVKVASFNGKTEETLISPKGVFVTPKDGEKAIVMTTNTGTAQNVVLTLQKEIEDMEEGDVRITDDKSYIHLHFGDGNIEIKTKGYSVDAGSEKIEIKNDAATLKKIAMNLHDAIDAMSKRYDSTVITPGSVPQGKSTTVVLWPAAGIKTALEKAKKSIDDLLQ